MSAQDVQERSHSQDILPLYPLHSVAPRLGEVHGVKGGAGEKENVPAERVRSEAGLLALAEVSACVTKYKVLH